MVIHPKTQSNFCCYRYVTAEPKWAKQLEGEVKLGKHVVTFIAESPVGDNVTFSNVHIVIRAKSFISVCEL